MNRVEECIKNKEFGPDIEDFLRGIYVNEGEITVSLVNINKEEVISLIEIYTSQDKPYGLPFLAPYTSTIVEAVNKYNLLELLDSKVAFLKDLNIAVLFKMLEVQKCPNILAHCCFSGERNLVAIIKDKKWDLDDETEKNILSVLDIKRAYEDVRQALVLYALGAERMSRQEVYSKIYVEYITWELFEKMSISAQADISLARQLPSKIQKECSKRRSNVNYSISLEYQCYHKLDVDVEAIELMYPRGMSVITLEYALKISSKNYGLLKNFSHNRDLIEEIRGNIYDLSDKKRHKFLEVMRSIH